MRKHLRQANLWGKLSTAEYPNTPAAILRKQSSELKEMTQGLLEGSVTQSVIGKDVAYALSIIAPALGGYSYRLLYIRHPATLYPLEMTVDATDEEYLCGDEAEFIVRLHEVLSSDEVMKVVSSLIAQSNAVV